MGNTVPLRALDVGCAVGGSTLELTRNFNEVIGVDFSPAFIAKAREVQHKPEGVVYYPTQESGLNYGDSRSVVIDPTLVCQLFQN
jgi:SAM-dependent methyltransferase